MPVWHLLPPQVDRKQVPGDWSRKLQAIQAKAAEAVRELPPGFLGQFEGGGDEAAVDFFLAQQVWLFGFFVCAWHTWWVGMRAASWGDSAIHVHYIHAAKVAGSGAGCDQRTCRAAPTPAPPQPTQVLAKLSETAEKGLLGGLKGAAGSWEKVVKAYEYNREQPGRTAY